MNNDKRAEIQVEFKAKVENNLNDVRNEQDNDKSIHGGHTPSVYDNNNYNNNDNLRDNPYHDNGNISNNRNNANNNQPINSVNNGNQQFNNNGYNQIPSNSVNNDHNNIIGERSNNPVQQQINNNPSMENRGSRIPNNNGKISQNQGVNNPQNKAKQEVAKKVVDAGTKALPPGLSQAAKFASKTKTGQKMIDRAMSKNNPFDKIKRNPIKSLKNSENADKSSNLSNSVGSERSRKSSNGGSGVFLSILKNMPKEMKFASIGICVLIIVSLIVVIIPAAVGFHKIGGLSLSNEIRTSDDVEDKLNNNANKMGEDDFDAGLDDEAYLNDYFEDISKVDNVILIAKNSYFTLDNLSDYYGENTCKFDDKNCIDASRKFFLKMYDLYYLYRTKYNVKLNLSLIMATLIYNTDDEVEIFKVNLSDYDRAALVESDWNPKETMELDWDYDYESQYNYLKSNDFSMDMQVLAKNMVSKTTVWKCYKDNEVTKTLEVKNDSEKLECGEGETLSADTTSYKLDLDKYDDFLLEYIEKKYYLKDNWAFFPVRSTCCDFKTDKKPSVMNKKTTSTSSNTSNVVDSDVVSRLNEIAEKQVGNGPYEYRMFMFGSDNGADWCAAFVSWLFKQVGGIDKYIVSDAGAGSIPRESIKKGYGTWYEDECTNKDSKPQAGDIIVYDPKINGTYQYWPYNGHDQYYSSHVGYIYKVDDNNVYTIEGNWNGQVSKRVIPRNQCGITGVQGINGYYRPNYEKKEITGSKTTSTSANNNKISSSGNNMIDDLISKAKSQVGNGGSKYRTYMFGYDNGLDWCAAFVSWLFADDIKSKYGSNYIVPSGGAGSVPRGSVPAGYGTWYEDECTDSSTVPQKGDIILYDPYFNGLYWYYGSNSGASDKYFSSHIGFVVDVDDNYVYTIEGNLNNQVQERTVSRKLCRTIGYQQTINGYYRPNY